MVGGDQGDTAEDGSEAERIETGEAVMDNQRYVCPVCGYEGLDEPPKSEDDSHSYEICPCCGFEFGFDDESEGHSYQSYRRNWVVEGARWFIEEKRPENWNLKDQLRKIGVDLDQ